MTTLNDVHNSLDDHTLNLLYELVGITLEKNDPNIVYFIIFIFSKIGCLMTDKPNEISIGTMIQIINTIPDKLRKDMTLQIMDSICESYRAL